MIKYHLKCKNNHEFESWFSDSKEFDNFDDWMKVVKTNRRYKKMSEKEVKEAWFFQVLKRRKREPAQN